MFETFTLDALAFHLAVIAPAFADLTPQGFPFRGTLNEFTLMPNVVTKAPIIDIRRQQNILQRRDASCDIIYKKVFGASTRMISVEELYAGTTFCRNEFYQGALKDFRNNDPLFEQRILPYFQQAVNTDIATNAYFGDVDRVGSPTDTFSTTVFDGVFKWMWKYIDANVIPAEQSFTIANGESFTDAGGPQAAWDLLKELYDAQPVLMGQFTDSEKAFYVSKEIAQGYEQYLAQTATQGGNITFLQNGIKQLSFFGIELLVEPLWTPVITQIKGSTGYAAVLTIRNNFVFATDQNYGEGEDGRTALEVWYEKKDMMWYYRFFLKGGTQIALPEFIVVAMTDFQ
jgi:hypothetical protein